MRSRVALFSAVAATSTLVALGGGSHFVGSSCAASPAQACATPSFPGSGSANLWVDTNGGTCTRSASASSYVDASACSSFQAAYTAASCGDTVGVQTGSYALQAMSTGSKTCGSNTTSNVTFTSIPGQPASSCSNNSTVTLPAFDFSTVRNVTVACMTAYDNATSGANCSDISGTAGQHTSIVWMAFDHIKFRCAFFDSDHMRVTNSTFGPDQVCQHTLEDTVDFRSNTDQISDVIFDGDHFLAQSDGGVSECGTARHIDALQGYGISGFTLRNSTFDDGCYSQCIIFRQSGTGIPQDITFENDFFGQPTHPGQAIDLGSTTVGENDACAGTMLIQNNTFFNGAALHGAFKAGGCTLTFRNNIMTSSTCGFGSGGGPSGTYSNNVFYSGTACGTSTASCTPTYVNAAAADYHLASSDTCAKGASDQTSGNYPALDFDGDTRPLGAAVDAGADEIP